jgi:hypothetical protein
VSAANHAAVSSNETGNTATTGVKRAIDVSQNVRRKYFVSSLLQGRLIARLLGYWFVYHVMLWHAMFLYRWMRHEGEVMAGGHARTFADLYAEFAAHHYSLLVCALAILPLLVWDAVHTTHRFAGPVVRFRKAFAALSRGERIDPIKLREGDLMVELQDAFNAYLASLPPQETPPDSRRPSADMDAVLAALVGRRNADDADDDEVEGEAWDRESLGRPQDEPSEAVRV